jgi:hypothetical protein
LKSAPEGIHPRAGGVRRKFGPERRDAHARQVDPKNRLYDRDVERRQDEERDVMPFGKMSRQRGRPPFAAS